MARALGADMAGDSSATFVAAATDSREVRSGDAFFALDGSTHRGVSFVAAAFGSGCSVAVVPMDWRGEVPAGRCVIRVADPLDALVRLAGRRRDEWTCPVLAITGSAGKTSVKEMTAHALSADRRVLRSPGNFNTLIGLARTLLGTHEQPDVAVLECGASAPGEIARLGALVRPSSACVTMVAPAHLEGFGTVERVREEKLELLRAVKGEGPRIVDADDPAMAAAAQELEPRVVRLGALPGSDPRLAHVQVRADGGTDFRLADGTEGRLLVPGEHQARNALFAIAFAEALGVPRAETVRRLATFAGVPGRLLLERVGAILIADDSYNANPVSMTSALRWFAALPHAGRKVAALGDMLELGAESEMHHAALGREVAGLGLDLVVFTGAESAAAFAAASRALPPERCRHVATSEAAGELVAAWSRPGDAVLLKGSRGMRMERVLAALVAREDERAG
jgi:UDP-N-acetylmuramoyl-tripeptide--D-alanyl-D-alanine ligase